MQMSSTFPSCLSNTLIQWTRSRHRRVIFWPKQQCWCECVSSECAQSEIEMVVGPLGVCHKHSHTQSGSITRTPFFLSLLCNCNCVNISLMFVFERHTPPDVTVRLTCLKSDCTVDRTIDYTFVSKVYIVCVVRSESPHMQLITHTHTRPHK